MLFFCIYLMFFSVYVTVVIGVFLAIPISMIVIGELWDHLIAFNIALNRAIM